MSLKPRIKNIYVDFSRNIWNPIPNFAVFFGFQFHFSPRFLVFYSKFRRIFWNLKKKIVYLLSEICIYEKQTNRQLREKNQ